MRYSWKAGQDELRHLACFPVQSQLEVRSSKRAMTKRETAYCVGECDNNTAQLNKRHGLVSKVAKLDNERGHARISESEYLV